MPVLVIPVFSPFMYYLFPSSNLYVSFKKESISLCSLTHTQPLTQCLAHRCAQILLFVDFIQFKLLKHKYSKMAETLNCWVKITSILQAKERLEGVQGECSGWQEESGGIRTLTKIPEDLPCGKGHRHIGYNSKSRTRTSGWKLRGVTLCFNTGMPNPPLWNCSKKELVNSPQKPFCILGSDETEAGYWLSWLQLSH